MTQHVVTYDGAMTRWEPGARERLAAAALELFVEQGFAATTVPQITERAGLTTRTFFRHFADKREVLFGAEDHLPEVVDAQLMRAPAGMDPMALIEMGLREVANVQFDGLHEYLRTRRSIVRSDSGLRERELRKSLILAEAATAGFRRRGEDELTAALAAHISVTAFDIAIDRWLDDDDPRPLPDIVSETLTRLRSIVGHPERPAGPGG